MSRAVLDAGPRPCSRDGRALPEVDDGTAEGRVGPVYLCSGKDCRKRSKELAALQRVLDDAGVGYQRVRCQKICKSPVLGLTLEGRLTWFAKLRGKAAREALKRFLAEGRGPLTKKRVNKRSGKLR